MSDFHLHALFAQVPWVSLQQEGGVLSTEDMNLLSSAHSKITSTMEDDSILRRLCALLLKLNEMPRSNIDLQRFVFSLLEVILGLSKERFSDEVGTSSPISSNKGPYARLGVMTWKHLLALRGESADVSLARTAYSTRDHRVRAAAALTCALCFTKYDSFQELANDAKDIPANKELATIRPDQLDAVAPATRFELFLCWLLGQIEQLATEPSSAMPSAIPSAPGGQISESPAQQQLTQLLPALSLSLQSSLGRHLVLRNRGIDILAGALGKSSSNLGNGGSGQSLYELAFQLWTISLGFERTASALSVARSAVGNDRRLSTFITSGAIRSMAELAAAPPSRKSLRMALSFLRTLAGTEQADILTEMLTLEVNGTLDKLKSSGALAQANDEDMAKDVNELQEVLLRNYRDLSSFDIWEAEVYSGNLRWGLTHTPKFWRENARLCEKNEYKLVKELIVLLDAAPSVSSVALYDLGEFARLYPNGRQVVQALGGQARAMQMVDHNDTELAGHALQCLSKLMVTKWDHIAGSTASVATTRVN